MSSYVDLTDPESGFKKFMKRVSRKGVCLGFYLPSFLVNIGEEKNVFWLTCQ